MVGAKGRPRRMETEHSTYNVLLPDTTLTAIKEKADTSGVSSAQVVRTVLADGLEEKKKGGTIQSWCDDLKLALQIVREAYPVPRFSDGKSLGDQIAAKIESAFTRKGNK